MFGEGGAADIFFYAIFTIVAIYRITYSILEYREHKRSRTR